MESTWDNYLSGSMKARKFIPVQTCWIYPHRDRNDDQPVISQVDKSTQSLSAAPDPEGRESTDMQAESLENSV